MHFTELEFQDIFIISRDGNSFLTGFFNEFLMEKEKYAKNSDVLVQGQIFNNKRSEESKLKLNQL